MEKVPLLNLDRADAPLIRGAAAARTRAQFLAEAQALAATLPEGRYAINLCDRRDHFARAFAAVLLRGQTNLLPPTRAAGAVADIARAYPGSYLLSDAPFAAAQSLGLTLHVLDGAATSLPGATGAVPLLAAKHPAAIAFTSGSTGGPQAHVKSLHTLHATAQLCAQRFFGVDWQQGPDIQVLATVPPQHMYGLELSVMLPLIGAGAVHAGRPMFPADVAAALAELPEPRVLVTTPVHLRSLVASGVTFPSLHRVISATAPLTETLAAEAEQRLQTEVHEIYGCTEAGSMCTRRTTQSQRWQPYPGLRLRHHDGMTHVSGPSLDAPVCTPDIIAPHDDGTISLLGRSADMIKVAGKRASLTELTGKLLGIEGVDDGVVFLPESATPDSGRPAALVVAPTLAESAILEALAQHVDAVFLPRPLRKVERLPRNVLGKLLRNELLELLKPQR